MKLMNQLIAIVGGGPGGLTLARLLQLKGANVKVYERDFNKDARVQGSPLDMHEGSGLTALREANLLDEFRKRFRSGADRKVIVNERADIFFSSQESTRREDFGSAHFRPEIDRGPLRNMLLESLQQETVVWNSHFISMEKRREGWLLHFKNGLSAQADLVIAADGANSKLRPYITDIKPFYSGITMLEGNVCDPEKRTPQIYALLNGGALLAFGNTKGLFMGVKGSGDLTFYASFKAAENWTAANGLDYSDTTQLLAWFKKEYSEWSSIWHQLFENAATPFIPRPLYCMPLDQTWKALPNLTMLGDAAHVMPPSAGEGANMAMLDALQLSECLTSDKYSTLQEAISFYETDMRERAALAAKESLENGQRMHSEDALTTMVNMLRDNRANARQNGCNSAVCFHSAYEIVCRHSGDDQSVGRCERTPTHTICGTASTELLVTAPDGQILCAALQRLLANNLKKHSMHEAAIPNPILQAFTVLVGEWKTVGTHPLVANTSLHGHSSFKWIEGGAFLIWYSKIDKEGFPAGIAIFGSDDAKEEYFMMYFDERKVSRKYEVSFHDGILKWWRNAPGFSQQYAWTITDNGNTIIGKGQLSKDGTTWEKDLDLTFTRIQ